MAKVLDFTKPKQTFFCAKAVGLHHYVKVTDSYGYMSIGQGKGSVWNSRKIAEHKAVEAAAQFGGVWEAYPVEVSCVVIEPAQED